MPDREVPQIAVPSAEQAQRLQGVLECTESVHQYVGKLLGVLEEHYGIKTFASQTRLVNAD